MSCSVKPTKTVLLVDDEPELREVYNLILREAGYRVLQTGSGQEALQILKHESTIDLLLTDFMMPSMNGIELADHVCSESPSTKVLICSGSVDQVLQLEDTKNLNIPYIRKPMLMKELIQKVGEILDEPTGTTL